MQLTTALTTSGNHDTESAITTLATTSEPSLSLVALAGTTTLLPSPPTMKTESASWHSQWYASRTTPFEASSASAPAMLFPSSVFETGSERVNGRVNLDELEQFVLDSTMNDISSPLLQDPMPGSRNPSTSEPSMHFMMDNNNGGGEYEDFAFDIDDFVVIGQHREPLSSPTSSFVLFPPL